jgi:hypothetical protein
MLWKVRIDLVSNLFWGAVDIMLWKVRIDLVSNLFWGAVDIMLWKVSLGLFSLVSPGETYSYASCYGRWGNRKVTFMEYTIVT